MIQTAAASTPDLTNFTPGSVALAFFAAIAGVVINLQQMIVAVQGTGRLQSSGGPDVDSFVQDWGYERVPSVAATTVLTLSRQLTAAQINIPLGAVVQTPVARLQFKVIADSANLLGTFDPVSQTYIFPAGASTLQVLAQCVTPGTQGNVAAGTLTQLVSGFPGVNGVTNASAVYDGQDAASDSATKSGFVQYLQALGTSCYAAIANAIVGVGANLTFNILEYEHFDGSPFVSGFTVVVDDGSGAIPASTLTAVQAAIDVVRAAGANRAVSAPNNLAVNISVHINSTVTGISTMTQGQVTAALAAYINTLAVAAKNSNGVVSFAGIGAVIAAVPNVSAYSSLLVNGGSGDIAVLGTQLPRLGTVTFT